MWSRKPKDAARSASSTVASHGEHAKRTSSKRVDASKDGPRSASEKAPKTSRRFSSIAWGVSWGFWWRRIIRWIVVDCLVAGALLLVLLTSYARTLPEGTFETWGGLSWHAAPGTEVFIGPAPDTEVTFGPSVGLLNLDQLEMTVSRSGKELGTFPLGSDLVAAWPVVLVLVIMQVGSIFGIFGETRRVRRNLQPLNDLAVRAEILGNMDLTSADKIESLEQAIERASVDSPQVVTGDKDLASIEVALNTLLRQMQEAKIQQMRFVSDASHELRTPIAVVQGYVNMLDRWGKDDPEVLEESIRALKAEGEHMQELVEQLLFLARGDSGRNTISRVPVNLAALVAEVWEEYTMIDAAHIYVLAFDETACASDARYQVKVDVAMMKQSMRIIIQNAAKYSSEGSEIRLGVESDGTSVAYFVQDAGIGMGAEEARHVFERFWRADAARETGEAGSGLGLSIAKWIVDAHAGSIELVSREGVGTRFVVRIPK